MNILQINTSDGNGGAERVARDLKDAYQRNGHNSYLAVGQKYTNNNNVLLIDNQKYRSKLDYIKIGIDVIQGHENFNFPATAHILEMMRDKPDIIHCHNLHGGYFDLRELSQMSFRIPLILTLHDAWLLAGHCAHPLDCERWRIGCGKCPDINLYQAIKRDGSAYNYKFKSGIYSGSKLYINTTAQWMMDKISESILGQSIVEKCVINTGIDLSIYKPADKTIAKKEFPTGIDVSGSKILLFTANGLQNNPWKDFKTLRSTLEEVRKISSLENIIFVALGGDEAKVEDIAGIKIYFVPYEKDPTRVAAYYQAADIYVHAARIDTFPNTVLEALACGTPVVATAVGGIQEQVDDGITGYLVSQGNAKEMAKCIVHLLEDDELRERMGANAAEVATKRFDINKQAALYLQWYEKILKQEKVTSV